MKVTMYFAGSKRDYDDVDLEKLINNMTINLQRVPCVGEQVSLMFDRYHISAEVSQVYTNWTEPGNMLFRQWSWGDRYAVSLTDIEIVEEYK